MEFESSYSQLRKFLLLLCLANEMLRHSIGGAVIFIYLRHFILPYLTNCPACKPKVQGIAIRAVKIFNFFNGNSNVLTFFGGKALVNKLWPLFYKRAELDKMLKK